MHSMVSARETTQETAEAKEQVRTSRSRGRPRSFDRATALEKALMAFWEHGYEATSVSDLTRIMGIGAPSLYAAFGDKRTLFEEVVRVYADTHGAFGDRALAEEPTARAAVERTLREAAVEYTDPAHPYGCLVVHAATNCTSPEVEELLRERRNASIAALESRIRADTAGRPAAGRYRRRCTRPAHRSHDPGHVPAGPGRREPRGTGGARGNCHDHLAPGLTRAG